MDLNESNRWPIYAQFTRGIRFGVAQDVMGAVIAQWSEMADLVRDTANPDASLSGILCLRHTMTTRSMYAKQEEAGASVAGDPSGT